MTIPKATGCRGAVIESQYHRFKFVGATLIVRIQTLAVKIGSERNHHAFQETLLQNGPGEYAVLTACWPAGMKGTWTYAWP